MKGSACVDYNIRGKGRIEFELSEPRKMLDKEYRVLRIDDAIMIYADEGQLIQLTTMLEKTLYGHTYDELDERIERLEELNDQKDDELEEYQGYVKESQYCMGGH